ncbi:MAG: hypothetical protein M1300_06155, partial [Epsilonproteobacteria bacterium]|nr:hypothetical protein [Campylobacterota bacterium]
SLYPFCPVFDSRQKHDKKTNLIIGAAFYMAEYERIVRLEEKGWTIKTRYSACGSTVGELIEALKNVPQDAVVKIPWPDYEDEQGMMFPVTGFTFNESSVDLQADED